MKNIGVVISVKKKDGDKPTFGFIREQSGAKHKREYFYHHGAVDLSVRRRLRVGDEVSFELEPNDRGKSGFRATRILLLRTKSQIQNEKNYQRQEEKIAEQQEYTHRPVDVRYRAMAAAFMSFGGHDPLSGMVAGMVGAPKPAEGTKDTPAETEASANGPKS